MSAENNLLIKLNETLLYAKQQLSTALCKLNTEGEIDVSQNDLSIITQKLNLVMDKVYRDMANEFSTIKEAIKNERKELQNSSQSVATHSNTLRERFLSRENQ
ncbi:hypothetical protein CMI47_12740 [Candidatus Pacearchaeota archaeon]|nr:hypothetical protein [Candidatus Pacearchaeota archaeon]|tara:strand:+ start:1243 stop:1551 length:309 start_codon:yes stop_codon:yes gene_type:complete